MKFFNLQSAPPKIRAFALRITDSFMASMGYPLQTSTDAYYRGYDAFAIMEGTQVFGIVAITVKDTGLWFHLIASKSRLKSPNTSWAQLYNWLIDRRDFYKCTYLVTSINQKNQLALKAAALFGFQELYSFPHQEYTFTILGGYDVKAAQVLRPRNDNSNLDRAGSSPRGRELGSRY